MQAAKWLSLQSISGGICALHASIVYGQRFERSFVLLVFCFLLCRLLLRKQGEIFGVAFGLHFFDGNEMQRGRVNGVAPASRRRSVVENVAEMGVAPGCADLGALHAEGGVGFFDNAVR